MLPPLVEETFQGYLSPLSPLQMRNASPTCFKLLTHAMRLALALAWASAGKSMPARIAMMAITTSNSIKVKALSPTILKAVKRLRLVFKVPYFIALTAPNPTQFSSVLRSDCGLKKRVNRGCGHSCPQVSAGGRDK